VEHFQLTSSRPVRVDIQRYLEVWVERSYRPRWINFLRAWEGTTYILNKPEDCFTQIATHYFDVEVAISIFVNDRANLSQVGKNNLALNNLDVERYVNELLLKPGLSKSQ